MKITLEVLQDIINEELNNVLSSKETLNLLEGVGRSKAVKLQARSSGNQYRLVMAPTGEGKKRVTLFNAEGRTVGAPVEHENGALAVKMALIQVVQSRGEGLERVSQDLGLDGPDPNDRIHKVTQKIVKNLRPVQPQDPDVQENPGIDSRRGPNWEGSLVKKSDQALR